MAKKIKSVVAWGALYNGELCNGWLYATKKLCEQEIDNLPYMRPIKVRVSVYKKRRKKP